MRGILLSLALLFVVGAAAPITSAHWGVPVVSAAPASQVVLQQNPTRDINVDVNVNRGGGAWYRSPVWIAIGVLAAIVILLLIVVAARGGGGTTIVKD